MGEKDYKNEKFYKWFDEYCVEDRDEVLTICQSASKIIWDRIRIKFDHPELLGATFSSIYGSILNQLVELEKAGKYKEFEINICDRLCIGYNNIEDEEDEKQGNFMIYIKHKNADRKNDDIADPSANSVERSVVWNTINIKEQSEMLRKIATKATEDLKSIDVALVSSEVIWAIFVSTYEMICSYVITKRHELKKYEYDINFCGCFSIGARESDKTIDDIYIVPSILSKLALKNDAVATASNE